MFPQNISSLLHFPMNILTHKPGQKPQLTEIALGACAGIVRDLNLCANSFQPIRISTFAYTCSHRHKCRPWQADTVPASQERIFLPHIGWRQVCLPTPARSLHLGEAIPRPVSPPQLILCNQAGTSQGRGNFRRCVKPLELFGFFFPNRASFLNNQS